MIRYFGSRGKIFNVHFRNIQGRFLDFRETFIDDGDVDMLQALRVYKEVGYDGMMMPDHVPQIAGDAGGRAGLRLHVRLHQGADPGHGDGLALHGQGQRAHHPGARAERGRDDVAVQVAEERRRLDVSVEQGPHVAVDEREQRPPAPSRRRPGRSAAGRAWR